MTTTVNGSLEDDFTLHTVHFKGKKLTNRHPQCYELSQHKIEMKSNKLKTLWITTSQKRAGFIQKV